MKFVGYDGGQIGVLHEETVHDLTDLPGVEHQVWPPSAMLRFIREFERYAGAAQDAVTKPGRSINEVHLETPLQWPNKVIAYPINYDSHGSEMNSPNRADRNGFFLKPSSALSGPADPIVLPDIPGREFHHEIELAIVIGKQGKDIEPEQAASYIFGYSCLLDITLRGSEERVMRKAYDSFCPFGPAIVTADEVGDPGKLSLRLSVNGELRQDGNTRDLILDVSRMVALASRVSTLYPGDIIATGTPAGVGPIKPGDVVDCEIDRVGSMSLSVIQGGVGHNALIGGD
ncbi:MAG: fumarylacetoacetate hydrolase family protein [Rhodovibrionaceae bacterium]